MVWGSNLTLIKNTLEKNFENFLSLLFFDTTKIKFTFIQHDLAEYLVIVSQCSIVISIICYKPLVLKTAGVLARQQQTAWIAKGASKSKLVFRKIY